MKKINSSKNRWIWLSVLILFVSVAATTIAVVNRLNGFLLDDTGAIPLIPEEQTESQNDNNPDDGDNQNADNSDTPDTNKGQQTGGDASPAKNPGFETYDDQTVWNTNTKVEIFRVSYVNGEQVITVQSDDGDKIIAPGTENTYTFKLKNTGDVALDYTVSIDAYFTPQDIAIPITGRVARYDGTWIAGDKENYADVSTLNVAEDKATLGAGKYTYYTLDWLWPFENGNDEFDTMLGNLAEEQDLVFTIVITTTATESVNPYDDSGITPQTGDNTDLTLWFVLAIGSFLLFIILIFYRDKEKRHSDEEEKKI